MIQIIYYVLFVITLIYGLYFVISGLTAFKKKRIIEEKENKINKFAILIAARNEEDVIGNLIDSLNKQNYDKKAFEVIAVINNSTDNTLNVAKKHNAQIIECSGVIKSKGDALKYAFNKLKPRKDIDAYVIFDADNIVDSNFLLEMNKVINQGFNVAEGFRESKNLSDNWLSGSYSIFYYIQNFFFNRSRSNIGLSSSINGTAFMVKKSLIDEKGFNIKSLTEDIEYTAISALNDEKIAFADKAITYDEQPVKFGASWKQRTRWTKGILQCLKYYHKPLLKKAFKEKSACAFDIFMVFLAPLMQIMAFVLLIILIIFKVVGIELYDIFSYFFALGIIFFIATYVLGVLVNIFVMKFNHHKISSSISGIFLFSVFIYTWIPINIACLFKKEVKWETIKHDRNIKIDNLKKD